MLPIKTVLTKTDDARGQSSSRNALLFNRTSFPFRLSAFRVVNFKQDDVSARVILVTYGCAAFEDAPIKQKALHGVRQKGAINTADNVDEYIVVGEKTAWDEELRRLFNRANSTSQKRCSERFLTSVSGALAVKTKKTKRRIFNEMNSFYRVIGNAFRNDKRAEKEKRRHL